ncbi:MAG TPA: sensor histidine kinase [Streptosporangiaceae bacterium]|nr:sensor histidine kinase [Streptosporangiaceae bacterium]
MLVIPLVSLIALWAYAAGSTVGGAIGKRHSDTANKVIGAPTQALFEQLVLERADTFIWQKAHGFVPRTGLDAQRKKTDAAVAGFRQAARDAASVQTQVARSGMQTMARSLGQLPGIRAQVDAGKLTPLAAFQAYNDIYNASFGLGHGTLADPNTGVLLYEQGEGAADEGEAEEYIGREAALVGGALVSRGRMSAAEHNLFVQFVGQQRLLEQIGQSPGYWQQNQDPYLQVFSSPAYQAFKAMEDRIAATSPGTPIPVTSAAWQQGLTAVMNPFLRAEVVARADTTRGAAHQGDVILLRLFLVGGAGLLAVVISALLLLGFGNRITRELTGFRTAVRALADERLPALVRRLRHGEDVDVAVEAPPLDLDTRTREVTETADAFSAVQRTAIEAAVGQAQLRKGVSNVFRSLARRNQSLLQRQLKMLDEMERGTHDPEALAQLFRLDHLTTRMRRQAEGLIILSGAAPGRGWRQPVPVVEVLRGAIGEIEDYVRVDLITESLDFITGTAVADVTHLLAELVENAVLYSPPETRVQVRASRVANGYVVEVEDRGLGIPEETLDTFNERLAQPPEFDLADSDQLGLFVVSRLAARHQIKVSLRGSPYGGTAAIVLMPHRLVVAEADAAGPDAAGPGTAGPDATEPGTTGLDVTGPATIGPDATGPDPIGLDAIGRSPTGPDVIEPWNTPSAGSYLPAVPFEPAVTGPLPGPSLGLRRDLPLDLPRRQRQANLAPQLRDAPPAARLGAGGYHEARSAEEVRAMISSIQKGWRSGRAAAEQADDDIPGRGQGPGGGPGSGRGEAG